MKAYVVAVLIAFALAMPALAAERFFVTVDTVGNCSVVQGEPSAGQKSIGESGGYDSAEMAAKALKEVRNDADQCKGVVE